MLPLGGDIGGKQISHRLLKIEPQPEIGPVVALSGEITDPESAEIYLQLAQTHRARGDASQARATAERGMLFCVSASQCDALRALTR